MECRKCGTVNGDDYKFCKNCGALLAEEAADVICGNCGKKLEPDSVFCPFCGTSVIAQSEPGQAAAEKFYSGEKAVSAKKPFVMSPKASHIAVMVKAWVFAALFLLMFGLSFLSFAKVDLYDELGIDEKISVSAVDVIEVAFSKKQSLRDVISELSKKIGSAKDDAAKIKIIERYNALKIVFCRDFMESMPFVLNIGLISMAVLVFALMFGSLTFAVLFLIRAIKITMHKTPVPEKDISGLGFGIMTAIALFSLSFTAGGVGAGPLAAMILGFCGLGLNILFNAIVCRKRCPSVKKLVTQCISLALGITLLFTLTANHYGVSAEVEKETASGKTYTATERISFGAGALFIGTDLFSANEDSIIYIKDLPVEDINENLLAAVAAVGNTELVEVAPPNLFFYAEMNSGYNAAGLALGVLSFVFYYAASISLAVMLGFIMTSLADFGKRTAIAAHAVQLASFMGLLVISIINVAVASMIIDSLTLSFKAFIGAAPIINFIFAVGMFVQNIVLGRKGKTVLRPMTEN